MEQTSNDIKTYMDYYIFMLGIKYLPSYYDNNTKGYMWDLLLQHKNLCPKLEIHYLSKDSFIATFDEFISGKTDRLYHKKLEGIHHKQGWLNELWRIKDKPYLKNS